MNENIAIQTIEITKSNIQEFGNLDIVAFSLAYAGAMGEKGGIYIITSDSKLYHTIFLRCGLSSEEVHRLCPVLKNSDFGVFGLKTPDGWSSMYMGGGNFLIMNSALFKTIEEKQLSPYEIYKQWKQIVIKEITNNSIGQ